MLNGSSTKFRLLVLSLVLAIGSTSHVLAMKGAFQETSQTDPTKKRIAILFVAPQGGDNDQAVRPKLPDDLYIRSQEATNRIVAEASTHAFTQMHKNWKLLPEGPEAIMSTESKHWEPVFHKARSIHAGKVVEANMPTMVYTGNIADISKATEDLILTSTCAEGTMAQSTSNLCVLRELMGEEAFTDCATQYYNMCTRAGRKEDFFHGLAYHFLVERAGPAVPGSLGYLANLDEYKYLKPDGNGTGDNVVCIGEDKFLYYCPEDPNPWITTAELEEYYHKEFMRTDDVVKVEDLIDTQTDEDAKYENLILKQMDEIDRDEELSDLEKSAIKKVKELRILHEKMSMVYTADRSAFTRARLKAQQNYNFHRIFDRDAIEAFIKTRKLTFDE